MDHSEIEEQQIVDRYVRGTLPAAEAELFEEHYLSCPECLDQLELAKSIHWGFQRAAEQDATRLAAARQLSLVAWLSRLGRSRQMAALAMALFVVAVLPVGLALREVGERDRELVQARSALEQEREHSAAVSHDAAEAGRLHTELEASRRDLARVQEAQASTVEQLEQSRQPQVNVPILFLSTERGNGSSGEPSRHLPLPDAPGWIVFDLEIDPPYQSTYRVILRSSAGRDVWRGNLARNERESLTLSLHSSLLEPGDYSLAIEGLRAGKPFAAGRFTFRVLRAS